MIKTCFYHKRQRLSLAKVLESVTGRMIKNLFFIISDRDFRLRKCSKALQERKMTAKKGDWVRIHKIVMHAGERAPQVPEDTAKVSFEMWQKGFLLNEEAEAGSVVDIKTVIGRKVSGTLIEVNPYFTHSFGKCVPEIQKIDQQLRNIMKEDAE